MKSTRSKPILNLFTLFALLASLLGSAVIVTPAYAAGMVVNSNADTLANDGSCTLREAITNANANSQLYATAGECAAGSGTDTITFAADYTITLAGSQLPAVTTAIAITGNGAANTILQANAASNTATYRVFEVNSTGNLSLDSLTVRNGRCNGSCATNGQYGAGIYNAGTLTVSNVTFSANSAPFGGGMYNTSSATLTNVTFSGNSATGPGGGMYNYYSSPTLTNVTFSGNTATSYGGGMINLGSSPTLTNVTFSGNSATQGGGGMSNFSSSPTLTNTLMANSVSGADCVNSSSTLNAASSNNLIENGANACGLTNGVNGNIIGQGDPNLGALADNGGTTQTFALLTGSPAIDAGTNTGCPTTDQRGVTRPQGLLCDIGAYEVEQATQLGPDFVVNTSADTDDGFCDLFGQGTDNQDCTLREAINAANAGSDTDIITFAADYTITLVGSQLPAVTTAITITGNGAANTIIQANAASNTATYRVLEVSAAGDLTLDGLTVRNGRCNGSCATSGSSGGGIYNAGTLTVSDVNFSANSASGSGGGGMYNKSSATLTNVTFSGNSASGNGGGMYNQGSNPTLTNVTFSGNSASGFGGGGMYNYFSSPTLTNVTFSANTVSSYGGGMYNYGSSPTLMNVTFSANSAPFGGGGMYNESNSRPRLTNTLIANSPSGGDCVIVSNTLNAASSNNLIEGTGTNACGLTDGVNGNIIGQDPALSALADNGGTTQTFALLAGSPAIDAGTNTGCPTTDQRGVARPYGDYCDIGAYEYEVEPTQPGPDFVVNTSADTDDDFCDLLGQGTGNQDCTLREAINAANTTNDASEITFAADYTITLAGSQLPAVTTPVTITGDGVANTIIQANAASNTATYRVFEVSAAGDLTLDSLTVRHGRCNGSCATDGQSGGGIYNVGALTVSDVNFSANSAGSGGGLYNYQSSATLTNVTFSSNSAFGGGGMYNYLSNSTLTNVTFSTNTAVVYGGGMANSLSSPTLTNVTFSANSANSAGSGGGLYNQNNSNPTLTNTLIANSSSGGDCVNVSSTLNAASSNNLIEGTGTNACGLTDGVNGNIIGQDPNLGVLADNGGTTQTHALLTGSPAIDAGTNTGCPATDQRGVTRPQGSLCDIGAYEAEEVEPTQPGPDFVVNTTADTDDGYCDLLGQGTGNQDCTLREAINAANNSNDTSEITFAADYTITLAGSQLPAVTTAITITGNGAANTIIQANAAPDTATYRVFEVSGTGDLTLEGLTVRNGRCDGSCATNGNFGGGIYNVGALTVSDVTFSGNSATYGGGMFNQSSSPTLTNVIFSANSANGGGGMFNNGGSNPTLTNVTFSANSATSYGGGMLNDGSNPTLTDVTFSGNSASDRGAGMYNYESNPTLTNLTFSANSAYEGGGIFNLYNSSPMLTNVTFSGNSASSSGGAMYNWNGSNPQLLNVTFSGNSATTSGGGMFNGFSSSPTLTNTLIANSASGGDCVNSSSTLNAASSNNLIEDSVNACGLTDGTNGNIIGQDPNLGALADNGGTTQTHALLAVSPAIDTGTNTGCPATDQRGVTRPQGAGCDIGALETEAQSGPNFVVNTNADTDDGTCNVLGTGIGNQDCTLREAINVANASAGTDTITFVADYTITLAGSQLPAVTTAITITGNGTANTIIEADAAPNTATYRVFEVSGTGDLTLNSLTVRNGRCNGSCATFSTYGGGIFNVGALTVSNVTFSANSAVDNGGGIFNSNSSATLTNVTFSTNSANYGGGIYNNNNSNATLTNVTFSANTAAVYGGGMLNYQSSPTLTNVTFSANTAAVFGGGMYNYLSSPALTNVTFSANTATVADGGGMFNFQSSPTLTNTLIANSTSGGDCVNSSSTLNAASSNNLIEGTGSNACDLTDGTNGNIIGQDPNLGALADSSGFTQTHALLSDSPAIDAGDDTTCAAAPVNNESQNGVARPYGSHCDIGAHETEYSSVDVIIGTSEVGSYLLVPQEGQRKSYVGVNNGPVKIINTDGVSVTAAERVIYKVNGTNTSFSEMMGLPDSQLDTTYWLPWYNNVDLDTQLRFGNVSASTATVHVYIGDVEMTGSPFTLAPGASRRQSFAGINNGPVKIESDVPIVAAERVIYKVNNVNTSFSEMMALPNSQLDTTYWLPWYNNVDLDTQLRFGNVSSSTATVHVYIGGVEMTGSPFTLAPGASTRQSFASINNGPVKIESDVPIVAAERVIYKAAGGVNTSFSETMALPNSQLDTTYWLPWYNNVDLDTQLRFGNVSASTATVHVYIGGVEMTDSPFTLLPGESTRQSFVGINNGPVEIVSDIPIVAAERVIYKVNGVNTSFSEMMALPDTLLDITYWFPWYNNVDLDTQLRFGVP